MNISTFKTQLYNDLKPLSSLPYLDIVCVAIAADQQPSSSLASLLQDFVDWSWWRIEDNAQIWLWQEFGGDTHFIIKVR